MKFLADMGISPCSVAFLREAGYEAVHLHELGQDRWPDPMILEKALLEGYVVLTDDLDFSELVAVSGAHLPSVIAFRLRDMRPGNVNRHLRDPGSTWREARARRGSHGDRASDPRAFTSHPELTELSPLSFPRPYTPAWERTHRRSVPVGAWVAGRPVRFLQI